MTTDALQMGLDGEPGARRVRVAAGRPLPPEPQLPTAGGGDQTGGAQRVHVAEVPRRAALHQRHHLTRHQVCEAVEEDGDPGGRPRSLELGRARRDLEAEHRPPTATQLEAHDVSPRTLTNLAVGSEGPSHHIEDRLSRLARAPRVPPGVDVVSGPVVEVVQEPGGTADRDGLSQPGLGERSEAADGLRREVGRREHRWAGGYPTGWRRRRAEVA